MGDGSRGRSGRGERVGKGGKRLIGWLLERRDERDVK